MRCAWAKTDLSIAYHDREWGLPLHGDDELFGLLVLEGAQAGLSWETILRKRDRYREVFDGYSIPAIAAYDERKVASLLADAGIIRNRAKIASAIGNARATVAVQREFGSLDAYLWSFVNGVPINNDRRKRQRGYSRENPAVRCTEHRFEEAWFPVRGIHDLLRLHAIMRHGERSCAGVFSAR